MQTCFLISVLSASRWTSWCYAKKKAQPNHVTRFCCIWKQMSDFIFKQMLFSLIVVSLEANPIISWKQMLSVGSKPYILFGSKCLIFVCKNAHVFFCWENCIFILSVCIENCERVVAKLEKSGFLGQLVLKTSAFFGTETACSKTRWLGEISS
jgi:hypothetical protein